MSENHCVDCCCARSWKALGIVSYTGKSIPEHISELRAENDRLNMEMVAYRQKLTPKDVEAMTAVIAALNAEKAGRATAETSVQPKIDQAPIARLTVTDSGVGSTMFVSAALYAPGLPPGEHDVYCEPEGK